MAAKTAGTWGVYEPVGVASLTNIDTTQAYPLGKRCKAKDLGATNYGHAEFVYLKGATSTKRGSLVVINDDYTTTLAAARAKGALALALGAVDAATKFGWYQILGTGVAACGTTGGVSAAAPLYISATTGEVDDAAVAGDQIIGMRSNTGDDTSTCVVTMATYPATADFDNA